MSGIVKHLIFITTCLFILPLPAQTRVDSIRNKIQQKDTTSVLVAAHRGHWRNTTENSLSAIESAIKVGVDIIEIDIQRTKDGHLILMHDETLERTTTGAGRIDSLNLEDIKELFLRNGIGVPTNQKVPTLKEALELAKGKVFLNLDKADRYIDDVYKLLKQTKCENMVVMKTSKPFVDVRVQFHEYLFHSILMPIIDMDMPYASNEIISYFNFMRPPIFELTFSDLENKQLRSIVNNMEDKAFLWYNTMWDSLSGGLNDDDALDCPDQVYGYLIDTLHANIIQTDRPAFLLNYLRKRGLHD